MRRERGAQTHHCVEEIRLIAPTPWRRPVDAGDACQPTARQSSQRLGRAD
ncbi:hypothetical protein ATSB10_12380 [Dyella thiooxydans]|uniref:Uncharacterized protein n=1 Tax=Dyella thiooxydans TaxID=445710 RepID=A0A160N0U6_9GAMM|nr:hypothetical protein ATSB10_12380 [Dyella thiooxydans]